MKQDLIAILDLGSEENSRVARKVRELGVYSEIYAHDLSREELMQPNLKGIIVNGGSNNIVDGKAIEAPDYVYSAGVPVFVIEHNTPRQEMNLKKLPCEDDALLAALRPFLFDVCKAQPNWNMKNFVEDQVELLRRQIGDKKVLLALSGGVDSSVVAALLIRAVGKHLTCVHVNHVRMRKRDAGHLI